MEQNKQCFNKSMLHLKSVDLKKEEERSKRKRNNLDSIRRWQTR
jgi:hypothetical protein